jgi:N-acetylmuramic acid 6-phosphate etherase
VKLLGTEQRNPQSLGLDRKSTLGILRLMNREDARVAPAVRAALPQIARAVDAIVRAFRQGGRLFYVGAGTSGRLAVLDAAECPPTFGTPASMVKAVMAGGRRAILRAVEGAEDSTARGARDLAKAGLKRGDVVVGIAASGTTPYVLGALRLARRRGAATVGVTSNPRSPLAQLPQIPIVTETGPEVLTGSTRLKAGTAQKMVLNMLSTAAMVRMGRIYENQMAYLIATNEKLRRRSVRILADAAGASVSTAKHALRQAGHDLPLALVMLKTGLSAANAQQLLSEAAGNVRQAVETAGSRPRKQNRQAAKRN